MKETFIRRFTAKRTNKAELRLEEQSENRKLSGEFMEWNTGERAIQTEIHTRREQKAVGKLRWFMSDINSNIPTTCRWACRDPPQKDTVFNITVCNMYMNNSLWACRNHVSHECSWTLKFAVVLWNDWTGGQSSVISKQRSQLRGIGKGGVHCKLPCDFPVNLVAGFISLKWRYVCWWVPENYAVFRILVIFVPENAIFG